MNYQGRSSRLRAFLLLPVLMLFAFAPLKTRPVKYEDRFGNLLTIFPNCKDDGFSFTLIQTSEKCADMITGGVGGGRVQRYEQNGLVLVFKRRIHAIEVVE